MTNSAILRVASTSVKSQPCFNVIVWILHHQVTLPAQKGVETPFPCVPTPLHPCLCLHILVNHFKHSKEPKNLSLFEKQDVELQKVTIVTC